ncbi:MAG: hypothetical protein MUE90_00735 [Thermoanaerobaculales bacterium]|nr:hypothetical protein [Thermoanaerobaculales bacterium]
MPPTQEPPASRWRAAASLLLPVAVVLVLLNAYALWYVAAERTLYHADQVAYWSYSQGLAQALAADPPTALRAVASSVANNDLNLLPALPVAVVMAVLGASRLVYVLAVVTIYGGATVLALVVALRRFGARRAPWIAALALLLVAVPWRAVLIGYLDIGGVALALAVLALTRPEPAGLGPRRAAGAGAVLALLALFRRWWGIWAVAFCLVLAADAAVAAVRARRRGWRAVGGHLLGPLVLVASAALVLVTLAAPIVVQRLRTDYGDRFAAYAAATAGERIEALLAHYGVLGLALAAASAALLLARPATRRVAARLCLLLLLSYTLMIGIQDHSPQHWYLYDPQLLLLVGLAADRLLERCRARRRAAAALVAVGALMTAAVYLPGFGPASGLPLLPQDRARPQVRNDLDEVERLLVYLDRRCAAGGGPVYVLASSGLLSDQVLAFANLSLGTDHPSVGQILGAAHVDRRDGFPRGLLAARTVLVAFPIQVHLRAADQLVVVEPATSFRRTTDVALAFRPLARPFVLDGGVEVWAFERLRAHSADEVAGLGERLRSAYPDRPEIFRP